MDYSKSEDLWKRMNSLASEYQQLQVEIQNLEDVIADDLVGLTLMESEARAGFLEMRDLYSRRMAVDQRKLALLQEQLTENRQSYRRASELMASIQGRLQAAE